MSTMKYLATKALKTGWITTRTTQDIAAVIFWSYTHHS